MRRAAAAILGLLMLFWLADAVWMAVAGEWTIALGAVVLAVVAFGLRRWVLDPR